jgi:hypothetical protein
MKNIRAAVSFGFLVLASGAVLADDYEDLIRAQQRYGQQVGDANRRYGNSSANAQNQYYDDVRKAQERYQREVRDAYRDRDPRDIYEAQRDYGNRTGDAARRYQDRIRRAQETYSKEVQRARERYQKAQSDYYRDAYRWEHNDRYGRYQGWNNQSGWARHQDDWQNRGRYDYPNYGYDYSNYYWGYDPNNTNWYGGYNQYGYRGEGATYYRTQNGQTGYYYPHEDEAWRNWQLSVGVSFPGNTGYVNYDPYTYGYGNRYSYDYYRNYRWDNRLALNGNQPSFNLSAGSNYYGDSYLYGNLYFPF